MVTERAKRGKKEVKRYRFGFSFWAWPRRDVGMRGKRDETTKRRNVLADGGIRNQLSLFK
jgi:hypothetical protein